MKTKLENLGRTLNPTTNLADTIMATIRKSHRTTNTLNSTYDATYFSTLTADQIKNERRHQLEAEGKNNEAVIYAKLYFLK